MHCLDVLSVKIIAKKVQNDFVTWEDVHIRLSLDTVFHQSQRFNWIGRSPGKLSSKSYSGDKAGFCTLSSGRLLQTEHPGSHPNHRAPSFYQDVVLILRFSITFCLTASAALTTPIPERPEGKKSYVFFETDFAELLLQLFPGYCRLNLDLFFEKQAVFKLSHAAYSH